MKPAELDVLRATITDVLLWLVQEDHKTLHCTKLRLSYGPTGFRSKGQTDERFESFG